MVSAGGVRPHGVSHFVFTNRTWANASLLNKDRQCGAGCGKRKQTLQQRGGGGALSASAVGEVALSVPTLAPILLGGGLIGGIFGWRLAVYSQLEYITASMLTNYVIKGGARVVQIGGGTRELYYYPKGTVQVTYVGSDVNKGLLEQAGVSAKIPVVVRGQPLENATMGPASSADAVALIGKLSSIQNIDGFLKEIYQVLKPGAPLIFIERVAADGVGSILQGFLGDKSTAVGFDEVNWDIALDGQDPHAMGVASKSETPLEVESKLKRKSNKKSTGFS